MGCADQVNENREVVHAQKLRASSFGIARIERFCESSSLRGLALAPGPAGIPLRWCSRVKTPISVRLAENSRYKGVRNLLHFIALKSNRHLKWAIVSASTGEGPRHDLQESWVVDGRCRAGPDCQPGSGCRNLRSFAGARGDRQHAGRSDPACRCLPAEGGRPVSGASPAHALRQTQQRGLRLQGGDSWLRRMSAPPRC